MFKVGDEVVCIKRGRWIGSDTQPQLKRPVYGSVYTIREIFNFSDGVGITLLEIINPKFNYLDGYGEKSFDINKFRKIERHTAKEVNVNYDFVEETIEEQEPQLA